MQFRKSEILVTVAVFLVACGPGDPSVRYGGTTLAAHHPRDVKVFRGTAPNQPFAEMGTITVACPSDARQRPFGQVSVEGGCDYQSALEMAIEKAAQAGADAIFHIETASAGNGDIVTMTAVAARFTGEAPEAPAAAADAAAAAAPQAPKSTLEERLKRLKELADQGLITPDEYAKRKAAMLDQEL